MGSCVPPPVAAASTDIVLSTLPFQKNRNENMIGCLILERITMSVSVKREILGNIVLLTMAVLILGKDFM
jgi:hypothetical protein